MAIITIIIIIIIITSEYEPMRFPLDSTWRTVAQSVPEDLAESQ